MKLTTVILLFILLFENENAFCQATDTSTKSTVLIGNINMESVIIHVYRSKSDLIPTKEFIIITDEQTGKKQAISATIQGKTSSGGFIIVNGIKTKEEIEKLMEGEKVYQEIVANDVSNFEEYETIIDDYIKTNLIVSNPPTKSQIENNTIHYETEKTLKKNSVEETTASKPISIKSVSKKSTTSHKTVKVKLRSNQKNKIKKRKNDCFSF